MADIKSKQWRKVHRILTAGEFNKLCFEMHNNHTPTFIYTSLHVHRFKFKNHIIYLEHNERLKKYYNHNLP